MIFGNSDGLSYIYYGILSLSSQMGFVFLICNTASLLKGQNPFS